MRNISNATDVLWMKSANISEKRKKMNATNSLFFQTDGIGWSSILWMLNYVTNVGILEVRIWIFIGFLLLAYGSTLLAYGSTLSAYGSTLSVYVSTLSAYVSTLLAYDSTLLAYDSTLSAYGSTLLAYGLMLPAYGLRFYGALIFLFNPEKRFKMGDFGM